MLTIDRFPPIVVERIGISAEDWHAAWIAGRAVSWEQAVVKVLAGG